MTLVGIDFSLNSTGVCILKDDKYTWLNFAANVKFTNKGFYHHNLIKDFVNIWNFERKVPKTSYVDEQSYKIQNAYYLATHITSVIEEIADGDEIQIAFEGFSYGSKGRSFIDLIAYNSILKGYLIHKLVHQIHVFSPSEIKKDFTGKGNCGKDKMFDGFIDSDDEILQEDKFYGYCKDLSIVNGEIPKPMDDLIDSYAILRKLVKHSSSVDCLSSTDEIR